MPLYTPQISYVTFKSGFSIKINFFFARIDCLESLIMDEEDFYEEMYGFEDDMDVLLEMEQGKKSPQIQKETPSLPPPASPPVKRFCLFSPPISSYLYRITALYV